MVLLLVGCLCGCNIPRIENSQDSVPDGYMEQNTGAENSSELSYHGEDSIPSEEEGPVEEHVQEQTLPLDRPERVLPQLIHPEKTDFVAVSDYIPTVFTELKYATSENFTSQAIYEFRDAFLRYGTVEKLQAVSEELAAQGLRLKIWDSFRPVSAQFKLWQKYPDANFVANPMTGYSSHSKGNTVDLTLTDLQGNELAMPTAFDDFSALADRNYSDCTAEAADNALLLQKVMERHGFVGYDKEWWHYSDTDSYAVEEHFDPAVISRWYADCNEFISLRSAPSTSASVITRILVNEEFLLLGWVDDFALVDYNGLRGYVLSSYIQPVEARREQVVPSRWIANCEEFISLRSAPDSAEVITKIPAGETVILNQWVGRYARVTYGSKNGYVLSSYIRPENSNYFQACLDVVSPTDCYTYEQMLLDMKVLSTKYPQLVSCESIGTSKLGRDIPVICFGNMDAQYHVLLQGAIHGREHMTAWLLMAMLDYWVDEDLQSFDEVCFHIIPMSNPDGVVISQSRMLNDDQVAIYQRDIALGYTAADTSQYASRWKANGAGVDLNRNFSAGWEAIGERMQPSSQQYKGDAPFSAPETKALRDYTLKYHFDATVSYHAHGSVIYYQYGEKQRVNSQSESLGRAIEAITGYGLLDSSGVVGAGYKDWAIDVMEIPSLTIEIGCQDAPLAERECYSIFARNCRVLLGIAQWLKS